LGLVSKLSFEKAKKENQATDTAIKPAPPITLKLAIERFATKSVDSIDKPWKYCLMFAILHVAPFRAKVL